MAPSLSKHMASGFLSIPLDGSWRGLACLHAFRMGVRKGSTAATRSATTKAATKAFFWDKSPPGSKFGGQDTESSTVAPDSGLTRLPSRAYNRPLHERRSRAKSQRLGAVGPLSLPRQALCGPHCPD